MAVLDRGRAFTYAALDARVRTWAAMPGHEGYAAAIGALEAALTRDRQTAAAEQDEDDDGNQLGYMAIAQARIEHEAQRVAAARQAAETAQTPQLDLFATA